MSLTTETVRGAIDALLARLGPGAHCVEPRPGVKSYTWAEGSGPWVQVVEEADVIRVRYSESEHAAEVAHVFRRMGPDEWAKVDEPHRLAWEVDEPPADGVWVTLCGSCLLKPRGVRSPDPECPDCGATMDVVRHPIRRLSPTAVRVVRALDGELRVSRDACKGRPCEVCLRPAHEGVTWLKGERFRSRRAGDSRKVHPLCAVVALGLLPEEEVTCG